MRAMAPTFFELGVRMGGLTLGACSLTDRSIGKLALELANDERPAFGLLGDLKGGLSASFVMITDEPIPPGLLQVDLDETLAVLCESELVLAGGVADMRATIGEAIATRFATKDHAWVLRADWTGSHGGAVLLMLPEQDVWEARFHLAQGRQAA